MKTVNLNGKQCYSVSATESSNVFKNVVAVCGKKELQLGVIARKAGLSYDRFCRLLEKRYIPVGEIGPILDVLGVSLTQLVGDNEPTVPERRQGIAIHAGEILRTWRLRIRMSQTALAELLGLKSKEISQAERGFWIDTIDKVAYYLAPSRAALALIRQHYSTPLIVTSQEKESKKQESRKKVEGRIEAVA
jgi:plasmid maintenance system antidote protein VapI